MAAVPGTGNVQMVRTTMAIPIDISSGQIAKINLPPGATLAGPVKVLTLPNTQTVAHVTVMAPPGVVEKYVNAQAAAANGVVEDGHLPQITNPNTGEAQPVHRPAAPSPAAPVPRPAVPARPEPRPESKPDPRPEPKPEQAKPRQIPSPIGEPSRNLFEKLQSNKSSSKEPSPAPPSPAPTTLRPPAPTTPRPPAPTTPRPPAVQPPLKESKHSSSAFYGTKEEDDEVGGKVVKKKARLLSSSDEDNGPLTKAFLEPSDDEGVIKIKNKVKKPVVQLERPVKKKTSSSSKDVDKPTTGHGSSRDVDKPTTGYGLYFAEIVPTLKKENPKLDFAEVSKLINRMWENMDHKLKRDFVKKASRTGGPTSSPRGERPSSKSDSKSELSEEERIRVKRIKMKKARRAAEAELSREGKLKKRHVSDESPGSAREANPKRNVKRKNFHVNISEELDSDDTDWEPKKLDPSLKFKKKSQDDEELPSVLGIPPPLVKPSQPRATSVTSTAPPPLRKQTPTSDLSTGDTSHIKTKFRPICLKDGCYAHAAPSDARGQYWCSDPCCVTYCNQIFRAWVAARKANMIECA